MFAKLDSSQTLTGVLISIFVPLVLSLIFKSAQKETQSTTGSQSLSYPKAMRIFVYAGWTVVLAVAVLGAYTAKKADLKYVLLTMGLFAGLVLPLHLETFGVRITWDKENIHTKSPWRKRRTIPFSAVRSYDFSASMQWYRIHTEGHGIIRLHQFMRGIPELLRALPCYSPRNQVEVKL
jgi:hypothetical protein